MKRTLAIGLVVFALAGCAAAPSSEPTDDPVVASPSPEPEEQPYNPPPAPEFGDGLAAPSAEGDALAAQVADAFAQLYEWPDAGPYPEVVGFYGRGSADGIFIETVTTLVADPAVDDPRAIEICDAVTTTWTEIGSPTEWNDVEVRDQSGTFMAYCTNAATGP